MDISLATFCMERSGLLKYLSVQACFWINGLLLLSPVSTSGRLTNHLWEKRSFLRALATNFLTASSLLSLRVLIAAYHPRYCAGQTRWEWVQVWGNFVTLTLSYICGLVIPLKMKHIGLVSQGQFPSSILLPPNRPDILQISIVVRRFVAYTITYYTTAWENPDVTKDFFYLWAQNMGRSAAIEKDLLKKGDAKRP